MVTPTIDDLMWNELLSWRDMWFGYLSLSTKIVVAGLIAEAPELFWEIGLMISRWRFKRKFHFSLPESHIPNLVKIIAFIGWFGIVLGVTGEWLSEIELGNADASIESFITAGLTEAKKDNTRAIAFAGLNELEAAKLDKQAAQLRKDAETEHLARTKIEASVAWRHLTEAQKSAIGAHLDIEAKVMGFPRRSVSLWYNSGDTEGAMFAADIAEALRTAKTLRVVRPSTQIKLNAAAAFSEPIIREELGVILQATNDAPSRSLEDSIIDELNKLGFDASRQTNPPFDPNPVPQVWVYVEARPQGPQGEYKLQAERDKRHMNNKTSHSH